MSLPAPEGQEDTSTIDLQLHVVRTLAELQKYTPVQLRVPPVETINDQIQDWEHAVGLLNGETLTGSIADDKVLVVIVDGETPLPEVSFSIRVPISTLVGDMPVHLGHADVLIEDPEYVGDVVAYDDQRMYSIRVPSRKIKYTKTEETNGDVAAP